jgi:hypothetical protein
MMMFERKGAFLVNAGAASPDLLRSGGVTAVAHQLHVHGTDNESTAANTAAFTQIKNTMGFAAHGGWGVNGPSVAADVAITVARVRKHKLEFYIADTELYWLAGWNVAAMTEAYIRGVQAELGVTFPLAIVSFGFSEVGFPGATLNSGAETCRKLGVTFIPEGYDFHGFTYGMERVVPYLRQDGIPAPSIIGLGDKTLGRDVDWFRTNPGNVSGVWVWAAEQSGTTITTLQAVTLTAKVAPLTVAQLNELAWAKIIEAAVQWEDGLRSIGKTVPENGRIPHCKRIALDRTRYPEIQPKVDALLDSIGA